VYDDTKPFVYNYGKHVVLPMVMEHAANKLFILKKEDTLHLTTAATNPNPLQHRELSHNRASDET
jgi:hypothetical protein